VDIDLPSGSDETGADFDNNTHGCGAAKIVTGFRLCTRRKTVAIRRRWDNSSIVPLE
jgi:hypothetical protein